MLQNLLVRRRHYSRAARRFFMVSAALGFVIDGVYGVLLNLYLLRLDYDTTFIGQVNSIGLLAFAAASLPAGMMGARWSSRQMLRAGAGSVLLGTALLPLAESGPAGLQAAWFAASYAIILVGFSLFFVNGAPYLMAVVDRERQSGAFAIQTATLALAAFAGSLFGGNLPGVITRIADYGLDDPQPYRYTLAAISAIVLAAFVITISLSDEDTASDADAGAAAPEETPEPEDESGVWAAIGVMSFVRFLQVAGFATAAVFFNVYLDTEFSLSPGAIGAIASMGRLAAVPTVLLAPRLIRRTSMGGVATWGSLFTALALLPVALATQWPTAAAGYVGAVAATNLRFAAFIVYIMVLAPKRRQSVMAGAGEAAAGLSFGAMALGGGYLIELADFRALFLLGAGLSGLGTLIFWWYLRRAERAPQGGL